MIPLRDSIPTRTFPVVTVLLIAANAAAFAWQLSLGGRGEEIVALLGAVPARFSGDAAAAAAPVPAAVTLLTAMFLHGGILHLAGNMVFLWIFGNNVEDATGHLRYLLFYLLCGGAAAGAHILANPASRVPMVGASGAISGVLGAYLLLYPRARIMTLVFFGCLAQTVMIPAFLFLGFWFLVQSLSGAASRGASGGGVAWFAHVGGFVAGAALVPVFKRRRVRLLSPATG